MGGVPLLLVLALLSGPALAHVCFISPIQRGAFNVSTPGDPSCYRRTDYCGGVAVGAPLSTYVAGSTVTLTIEQNLNHFTPKAFMDVAVTDNLNPTEADFTTLTTWADSPAWDMVIRTVYTVNVKLPSAPSAHSILRVRYVTYNDEEIDPKSNTDAIFYNCADIAIVAGAAEEELVQDTEDAAPVQASPYNCTTPPQWTANFTESNAWGFVSHTIWWDSVANLTRWDMTGALDANGNSTISLINLYSQPIEYVNFVSQGVCYAYGNDAYYPFAFGTALSMTYGGRMPNGVDTWSSLPGGESTFLTQDLGNGLCKPVGWTRGQASVFQTGFLAGAIPASVFKPASQCTTPLFGGCHADAVRDAWLTGKK